MLIATTVVCVFLAYRVQRARVQRNAVAILKNAGADIGYDWQSWPLVGIVPAGVPDDEAPAGPAWLRKWIGDEYFQEVKTVYWVIRPETDTSAYSVFPDLPYLKDLIVERLAPYGPLLPGPSARVLVGLDQLECLSLNGVKLTDETMRQIGRANSLRVLNLSNSDFNPNSIQHLVSLQILECLYLSETCVNDSALAYIGQLHSLERLDLSDTDITDKGVALLEPLHNLDYFAAVGGQMNQFQPGPFRLSTISLGDDSLRHLARHKKLTAIHIGRPRKTPGRITGDGIKHLQDLPLYELVVFGANLQHADFETFERITTLNRVVVETGSVSLSDRDALQHRYPKVEIVGKSFVQHAVD